MYKKKKKRKKKTRNVTAVAKAECCSVSVSGLIAGLVTLQAASLNLSLN